MRTTLSAAVVVVTLGALFVIAPAAIARGQSEHTRAGFTPVVIAVPERFPYQGQQAVIIRRVDEADHDLILVRADALQSERLAAAVGTLQAARSRFGDVPTQDMLIRVPEGPPRGRIAEAHNWVDLLIKSGSIHAQPVPGLEHAQYIRLFLPNHTNTGGTNQK